MSVTQPSVGSHATVNRRDSSSLIDSGRATTSLGRQVKENVLLIIWSASSGVATGPWGGCPVHPTAFFSVGEALLNQRGRTRLLNAAPVYVIL